MTKNVIVTALVALVVSTVVGVYFVGKSAVPADQSNIFGGLSQRDVTVKTISVGSEGVTSGTRFEFVKSGTATCSGSLLSSITVTASTTIALDCSVTGARSGDIVLVGRPTGTLSTWFYVGAYASTTANDYIRAVLYNNTGVAAIPPSTATSSVPYVLVRY